MISGGSRILKRGVRFQYEIKACVAHMLGACPQPGKLLISDLLRLFLVYCLGEIAKVGTTKPSCCI